jgi:hypothetical protein
VWARRELGERYCRDAEFARKRSGSITSKSITTDVSVSLRA